MSEIERRLRSFEQQLERVGDPTSASRAALRGCEEHRVFCGRRRKRTEKKSLGSSPTSRPRHHRRADIVLDSLSATTDRDVLSGPIHAVNPHAASTRRPAPRADGTTVLQERSLSAMRPFRFRITSLAPLPEQPALSGRVNRQTAFLG
jgi:hypothetical protein